jgi:hypothetical protein
MVISKSTISNREISRHIAAVEDLRLITNQQATPGKDVMSKATPPEGFFRCITPAGVVLYKTISNHNYLKW